LPGILRVLAREERGEPGALSDGGSARREGRVYLVLVCFLREEFEPVVSK
jgi:hypothetical protein